MHRIHGRGKYGRPTLEVAKALTSFKDSAIIIDLDGNYLDLTKEKRKGKVIIIDPFDVGEAKNERPIRYNPLHEISLDNEDRALQIISSISVSCMWEDWIVNPSSHWLDFTTRLLSALIGHTLTSFPKEQHTLPFIYDLVSESVFSSALISDMIKNKALKGHICETATDYSHISVNEANALVALIHRTLKWTDNPQMCEHLSGLDFSFKNFGLQNEKLTAYIVFPAQVLSNPTWLRLMVSTGLTLMMGRKEISKKPIVFMVGEIPDYRGNLKPVADCYIQARPSQIHIWGYINHIRELKRDYPSHWEAMMNNSTQEYYKGRKRFWFF